MVPGDPLPTQGPLSRPTDILPLPHLLRVDRGRKAGFRRVGGLRALRTLVLSTQPLPGKTSGAPPKSTAITAEESS